MEIKSASVQEDQAVTQPAETPATKRRPRTIAIRAPNKSADEYGKVARKIEWRKGEARKLIVAGLAFCVAYAGDEETWKAGTANPPRLLRVKGACMLISYTGTLEEFLRRENQPVHRTGPRRTGSDSKSGVEDLCQEIENLTRITLGAHRPHVLVSEAVLMGKITAGEYEWMFERIALLNSAFPSREAKATAATDYATRIGLTF